MYKVVFWFTFFLTIALYILISSPFFYTEITPQDHEIICVSRIEHHNPKVLKLTLCYTNEDGREGYIINTQNSLKINPYKGYQDENKNRKDKTEALNLNTYEAVMSKPDTNQHHNKCYNFEFANITKANSKILNNEYKITFEKLTFEPGKTIHSCCEENQESQINKLLNNVNFKPFFCKVNNHDKLLVTNTHCRCIGREYFLLYSKCRCKPLTKKVCEVGENLLESCN